MAKDERLKLVEKIYNIVLAARTEGIVGGKTKRFAEDDTEAILALLEAEIGQERKRIYEWGNKACPHAGSVAGEPLLHKHDCYVCWETLMQGKVK